MTYDVYLSLGSNINPEANLTDTVLELSDQFDVHELSPVYLTEPIQVKDDADNFHNLCVLIGTCDGPGRLKEKLTTVEETVGREQSSESGELYESRRVDVDILLFEPEPEGFNPHPQIYDEAYVVYPLSDLYDPVSRDDLPQTVERWRQSTDSETIIDRIGYDWPDEIFD